VDVPLAPFAFRGDWDVRCELIDGPVEVLNVMTRRGRVAALVSVVALDGAPAAARKTPGEVLIAHCPAGPVTAYGSWGTATLERDDAVIVDEPAATEVAFAAGDAASLPIVLIRVSTA
jgi:environmental stress-induced protein Ves